MPAADSVAMATSVALVISCPTALTIVFFDAGRASRLAGHAVAELSSQTLTVRDVSRGSAKICCHHAHCERGRLTGR